MTRGAKRVAAFALCDCGNYRTVLVGNIVQGFTKSCGCMRREATAKLTYSHGKSHSVIHNRWTAMVRRCTNPSDQHWIYYGGRGIKVCERWRTFANFYADMGDPPLGLTLERIDNDGDYELSNCKWATVKEQIYNRRLWSLEALERNKESANGN